MDGITADRAERMRKQSPALRPEQAIGKWLVLVDDEPFDRSSNTVLELLDDEVRDARGGSGTAAFRDGKLILDLKYPPEGERSGYATRYVLSQLDEDAACLSGIIYQGETMPEGEVAELSSALEAELGDDVDDDERYQALPISDAVRLIRDEVADDWFAGAPGKYSVIDVSMYPYEKRAEAGFSAAGTDEEIDAALRKLPLARVVLQSGEEFVASELLED